MEMNSDDSMSLSSESGWSSSDDSDIEELLQDDDVEMMSLLAGHHDMLCDSTQHDPRG